MCTAKAAIRGRGWGDQTQLYKYNGNLLQISTSARLECVAGGTNFCRRKICGCMRKWKICRRKFALSADRGSGRATKRKSLLQYVHYGHVSHHLGDFRAGIVTGYVSIFTQAHFSASLSYGPIRLV